MASVAHDPNPTSSDRPEPPLGVPLLMPPPPPPPAPASSRRLPPPCWTPDETSALIDAYRDKWYSLRRGNLRAAHWQDVADDVHRLCPDVSPPKTAVQCRHKMEKLRKRYRAELQRAKSIPHHRFSSSWVYFSKMDSMEKGTSAVNSSSAAVSLSSPPVATLVAAAPYAPGLNDVGEEDDDDEDDDDEDYNAGGGGGSGYSFRNYEPRKDFNRDFHPNGLRIRIAGNSKNYGDFDESPNPNPNFVPKSSKYSNSNMFASPPKFDEGVRYATGVVKNGSNGAAGCSGMGMNMNMKKKKNGLGKRERERGDEAAMEMVEAIRMVGEGFVRMEKMKMEMMKETERMKMEMEMKRTEMILDSQRLIVEAFAKAWSHVNNNEDAR